MAEIRKGSSQICEARDAQAKARNFAIGEGR